MPVRTVARQRSELVTASPDTPVRELAESMRRQGVGSVVIEREEEPVGIVTDRDLAVEIIAEGKDTTETTARDVMGRDPITADADEGIFEVCQLMRERSIRRLPVVDDGKLVGIITLDDLMVLLDDEMGDLSDVIRTESPSWESR